MTIDIARDYCLAKPDASEGTPFGDTVLVFKAGGKMFALLGLDGPPWTVNLKCDPERAVALRERYDAVQPGYHMNKKHWNTVEYGRLDGDLVRALIDHSYDLIAGSLKKSEQARLVALGWERAASR
ncbi:MAG: MmcQ/YjbR family DNA-binding protein [Bacteroidota bacterium]